MEQQQMESPQHPAPGWGDGKGLAGDLFINDPDNPLMVYKSAVIVDGKLTGDPRVRGVGCSTMADTDGDEFTLDALRNLQEHSLGLNVILNHVPTVPANLFGSIMDTSMTTRREKGVEYGALEVESDVVLINSEAVKTYNMIAGIGTRARRLGFSVGCIYTDVKRRTQKAFGRQGVVVNGVYPGEYSILSMPSNRLSWIERVTKGMKTAGYLPDTTKGWQDDEVRYILAHREDFVTNDTDAQGLMVWRNLTMIAEALEPFGVKLARSA